MPHIDVDNHKMSDPQMVTMGTLKEGERSDVIISSIRLGLFELFCIVTIPDAGSKNAPVYWKFKVHPA